MKTVFTPSHQWRHWEPDRGALDNLLDLAERTWPEGATLSFEVVRHERRDEAEDFEEARELLDTTGLFSAATGIHVHVWGPHDSIGSVDFR